MARKPVPEGVQQDLFGNAVATPASTKKPKKRNRLLYMQKKIFQIQHTIISVQILDRKKNVTDDTTAWEKMKFVLTQKHRIDANNADLVD